MVEHVVSIVGQRCKPVFVVAAPGQPLPALRAEVLRDEVRGPGPLIATGAALGRAAQAGAQWAFVAAVDMPFLTTELIDLLTCRAAYPDAQAADVVLPSDGRDHYLAALYRTTLTERVDVLVAAGERSMRALVCVVDVQRMVVPDSKWLTNANSITDLP